MEVRNATGRLQIDAGSGLQLPPMGIDEWTEIPDNIAMRLWKLRIVEIRHPERMDGHLWKEADGTHIFWASPFSLADGYATAAENMVLALVRQGMRVHVASCWFSSMYGLQNQTVDMLRTPHPGPMMVGVCMATAGEFKKLPTPYKIGITMYEADSPLENLPEWRHDCRCLDMLITPSEHSKTVFAEFVDAPIRVIPLAVNPYYYTSKPKRVTKRPFTFGMHGTLTGRKSPLELADVFTRTFPNEPDVRLQLKTRLGLLGLAQEQLTQFADKRIQVINENWLHTRMRGWLEDVVDCYVFPSKGEGYGIPPREAMAAGCPTILSENTGLVDVCNPEYNWPIPTLRTEQSPLGGIWRIPDWDALSEAMRWVYDHRAEAYAKGLRGSKWFIENFGADAAARQLKELIESVDPYQPRDKSVPVAETLGNSAHEQHATFYEQIRRFVPPGKVVDVGVGEGVLYRQLLEMGYEVVGIVEPSRYEQVAQLLKDNGLPVNLVKLPLIQLASSGLSADVCLSQSVLQDYGWHEINLILAGCLKVAPTTLFSVPTVHYPTAFSNTAKLHRRGMWEDTLADFFYEMHYYGSGRRYIWARVWKIDEGRRFSTERLAERKGRVTDGSWRPVAKEQPNGMVTRGE